MRTICLLVALWNIIVASINVALLPRFFPSESLVYMTSTSQITPVLIPLLLVVFTTAAGWTSKLKYRLLS